MRPAHGRLAGDRNAHRSHTFAPGVARPVMSLRSSCDQGVKVARRATGPGAQVRALERPAGRGAEAAGLLPLGGSGAAGGEAVRSETVT